MSVAKMKRLSLFLCSADTESVISGLMKLRCVEISRSEAGNSDLLPCDLTAQKAVLEDKISRVRAAIVPLTKYSVRKFSLVKPKINTDLDEFVKSGDYDNACRTVSEIERTVSDIAEANAEATEAAEAAASLEPWTDSVLALDFSGTAKTSFIRGSLPASTDTGALAASLSLCYSYMTVVSQAANMIYTEVITLRGNEEKVQKTLAAAGFTQITLPGGRMTARMLMLSERKREEAARKRSVSADLKIRELAVGIDKLRVLCDIESTRLEALRKRELLLKTEHVELLTGWVPEKSVQKLLLLLGDYSCAYDLTDPAPEDDTPVKLENNRFASNFEWVVELYSLPRYGTFDPTFIMSICYCVLFGMMFADVGYGLIMIAAGFLVPKFLPLTRWASRFFRSFGWCGVACAFMGVLFGGYFGDFPLQFGANILGISGLPATLAIVADPILDSLLFMGIGIGAGVVHLVVGMAIKFHIIRKEQSLLDAIFDVGLWWVLFAGLALMFLVPSVGPWVLLVGAGGIFLTGGRHEKKWIMKPLKGLLKFYDIISYASDLLSYARILALGLTSAVIAQVVNILGTMAGPSVMGIIILVIAFIFGHALNIGLNVMGTFVHAARLQYVEFFSKFYDAGGKPFEPVKQVNEFTTIRNEN